MKSQLQKFLKEINAESNEQHVWIYNKENLNTDYIIILFNDSTNVMHSGSQLGLHLSSAFKEYGMINHNAWSGNFNNEQQKKY